MNRVQSAARLHLIVWPSLLAWPLGILAVSFVINRTVFAIIGDQIPGDPKTGGVLSIYVTLMIVAGQTVAQVFPFALGLSVTRRSFYAASVLLLAAGSVLFGVLLYLGKLVEDATGGWGIRMSFFSQSFMHSDNAVAQILVYTVPFLALGLVGFVSALLHRRWGVNGLFGATIVLLVLSGAVTALITRQRLWPRIGHWFADQSALSLFAGWPALLALVLAVVGYLVIRRATP